MRFSKSFIATLCFAFGVALFAGFNTANAVNVGTQITLPNGSIATAYIPIDTQGNAVSLTNNSLAVNLTNSAISTTQGTTSVLNISASTEVVTGSHRIVRVSVVTAGSTAGTINDSATTGGATAANTIASIPNTVGVYLIDWPVTNGLAIIPGTSQVVAVTYN